jgi:hypothetical protein
LLQACCIWNDFPNICLLKLKSCSSHPYKQSAIFLRPVRMTTHSTTLVNHARDHWWTLDFANAFVSSGVNSRGGISTLAPGLRPERRSAPLARGLWSPRVSPVLCWSVLNAVWLTYDCGISIFHTYARAKTHLRVHSF